ncbi:MAG: polyprenyl synthetase family protein [Candidatus Lokiarchaeota archaeon]|nr:polyprenyl synthetase family protein [Candidatus Lokiarchaeota archaeon]
MKFTEYAKRYIPKIDNAIMSIYDRILKSVENSFLKDYYSELKDYFLAGGKRIRPLLCIATYNAFNEKRDERIVLPSIGVEFLHNASLIHDDIIDKDNFRRGKPAFHFRFRNYHQKYNLKRMIDVDFGNSIGIIGGDSTFFLGLESYLFNEFEQDLNLKAINYYKQAFIEIANGVLIETDMVNQKNLIMSDYIKMISLKTGSLIEKSILIGANYAKVNEDSLKDLSIYATNLGIIFQIIDDILGTFGDEKVTGKPTDGDIREGKKTCLLIDALNKLEENDKNLLERLIEKPNMTIDDVQEVKDLFLKADVVYSSKELVNSYYDEAKTSLDKLKQTINHSEYEFFENLLNFVRERKF